MYKFGLHLGRIKLLSTPKVCADIDCVLVVVFM